MEATTPTPAARSLISMVQARRPGCSLNRAFYTDGAIFAADLERVFGTSWLCVGHVARIPRPGDYFTCEIGDDSLIIIRGDQGEVHALFNVCRHRGSRVCLQESGHAKKLVCPYHQWVYNSNGTLNTARHMPSEFDASTFDLVRACCEVIEGLIFVCFQQPPDFQSLVREIVPRLGPHGLGCAKIGQTRKYEVKANWKLLMENSRECYHCGVGHPQYCRAVGFAAGIDSPQAAKQDQLMEVARQEQLRREGIDPAPVQFAPDSWYACRRYFLREGFQTESMDGRAVAPVMGRLPGRHVGVLAVLVRPNLQLEVNPDYAVVIRFMPRAARLTSVEMDWLVRPDAIEGRDYDLQRLTEFWKLTAEQDWKLCENNQSGVNSSRYQPGPYAPHESGVECFIQWYLHQLSRRESDSSTS
jgi:glycine betaine catabolism A